MSSARSFSKVFSKRSVIAVTSLATGGYLLNSHFQKLSNDSNPEFQSKFPPLIKSFPKPPTREELLSKLGKSVKALGFNEKEVEEGKLSVKEAQSKYDLIIVGGGATGSGAALDASLRGLNVLLVEKNDFASGTSSKSTKMAHGGVRYLEKAIFQLSKAQLDLVIEALNERASILENAPHLATCLPILIPVYKYWQLPYFYAGCLLYDLFAGSQALRYSYIMSKSSTLDKHPQLDSKGLVGGLVYHDGLFNDSRMNVSLALTALKNGATVLNYMEVEQILKDDKGQSKGIRVKDTETNEEYLVEADSIISATGPYSDLLLSMDKNANGLPSKDVLDQPRMVVPSGGVHVILPEWYCAKDMGLLDANTSDGRVMFFLPWQGKVLAGTTDVPLSKVPENPVATESEIDDILKELQHYVKFEVRREDVLSAWCGVRPLVRDPSKIPEGEVGVGSTQGIVRNHLVYQAPNGLVTISGGKWTTYREMAEEVITTTIKSSPVLNEKFGDKACLTKHHKVIGGDNYDTSLFARLAQYYTLPEKLANHLAKNYGDRAPVIIELFKQDSSLERPLGLPKDGANYTDYDHPFTLAELYYSLDYEYARHPVDFLARRCRLAFLDSKKALECVDDVVEVMSKKYGWSNKVKEEKRLETIKFIEHMGVIPNVDPYGKFYE